MTDRHPNEPRPDDYQEAARRSEEAGIADESAAYVNAAAKESGDGGEEKESASGASSDAPAEGDEDSAPRQPGSPDG